MSQHVPALQRRSSMRDELLSRRRVVITGIGAVTPIGTTSDGLWQGIRRERSAVGSVSRFDPSPFRSHNAAEVNDFVPADHLEHKKAKRLDRFGQFSVVSARMALADSAIDLAGEDRDRIGTIMGTRSEEHTSELQSLAYLV